MKIFETINHAFRAILNGAGGGLDSINELHKPGASAHKKGDFSTAHRIFSPLADKGDAWAQAMLGVMYFNGEGVPKNNEVALGWFHRSAEQENMLAQYHLGNFFFAGIIVPADAKQAAHFYEKSAKQKNALAQYMLGMMYFNGNGVNQNKTASAEWLKLAAEQGQPDACILLGQFYAKGVGVKHDDEEAFKWYYIADHKGLQKAKEKWITHSVAMSEDQIARGMQKAWQWIEADLERNHQMANL